MKSLKISKRSYLPVPNVETSTVGKVVGEIGFANAVSESCVPT